MVYEGIYFSTDIIFQLWGSNSGSHVCQASTPPLVYIPRFLELTPKPRQTLDFLSSCLSLLRLKLQSQGCDYRPAAPAPAMPIHFSTSTSPGIPVLSACLWVLHSLCHQNFLFCFYSKWSLRCLHPAMTLRDHLPTSGDFSLQISHPSA